MTLTSDVRVQAQAQARAFQALAKEHSIRKDKRQSIQTGVGVDATVFSGRVAAMYALQRKITQKLNNKSDDDDDDDDDDVVPVKSDGESDEDEDVDGRSDDEDAEQQQEQGEEEEEGVIRHKDTMKIGTLGEGAFGTISLIVHKVYLAISYCQ